MSSPSQRENSRSSSISSSSGEENSPCKSADEPETIEYIPVELDAVESHMSSQDLESEDVELWLVQVPRHDTLLSSLKGSRIKIPKSENKSSAKGQAFNKKLGVFKGSYMFRDRGLEGQKNLRAVFVDKDEEGKPSLNVGTFTQA